METEATRMAYPGCEAVVMAHMGIEATYMACQLAKLVRWPTLGHLWSKTVPG